MPVKTDIEWNDLLQWISHAVCPLPTFTPGLEGIVGMRKVDAATGMATTPEPLSPEFANEIRALVSNPAHTMPLIHNKMNNAEIDAFLVAYRALTNGSGWEPVFCRHDDLYHRRLDIRLRHGNELRRLIAQGDIRHFDEDRVAKMPSIDFRSYFPIEDAQRYCDAASLNIDLHQLVQAANATRLNEAEVDAVKRVHRSSAADLPEQAFDEAEPNRAAETGSLPIVDSTVVGHRQKPRRKRKGWSKAELDLLVATLNARGVAEVIKIYGITERYVRVLRAKHRSLVEQAARLAADELAGGDLSRAVYAMGKPTGRSSDLDRLRGTSAQRA